MPFAQWHYPFENAEILIRNSPADFISEGIDQTARLVLLYAHHLHDPERRPPATRVAW
jgi:hypothetical protein